jgi:enoyl-CoA hydratase/carnithine racemase
MPTVLVQRHGARVDIVLNRPERKNSITEELAAELKAALLEVGQDSTVGCILLRGADGAFCSGIDLRDAGDGTKPKPLTSWTGVHAAMYSSRTPIVVAIERFAINAGAALALGGHVAVMGEGAFLQVSEASIGVPAPMCQAWLHLKHSPAVGDRVTLLTDRISAAECLSLGLVAEVVADGQVVARATELAERIAGYPATGRNGVARVWKMLRGEISNPEQWFADLLANSNG